MPLIINLAPTSELEAVNTMLSAIGEAPLADLSSPTTDVQMALNILRAATREVQSKKWRFNTEYNFALANAGAVAGQGVNAFTPPAGIISFTLSRTSAQRGFDSIVRKSRVFGTPGTTVVIADRLSGKDGFAVASLSLDVVWYFDFESMPDTARRYVTALAAQRFATHSTGTPELSQAIAQEVTDSGQALEADQSETTSLTIIDPAVALTELDAVNLMLSGLGQRPTPSLTAPNSDYAAGVIQTLRVASREVQARGWRFNTEMLTIAGTPSGGGYTFAVPADVLRFTVPMSLSAPLDLVSRGGLLFDRLTGTSTLSVNSVTIHAVRMIAFESLPDTARSYITTTAFLRIQSQTKSTAEVAGLTATDASQLLASMEKTERDPVPVVGAATPATELESLNRILVANGMAPIGNLAYAEGDAAVGLNFLRSTLREVLLEGWTFNKEYGLKLLPAGISGGFNVFKLPANVLKWDITKLYEQLDLDLGERLSKTYTEVGQPVMVLYDRINNVDGITLATLALDITSFMPFANIPQSAREYITVRAARMWAKQVSNANVRLTEADEMSALRALKRDQGNDERPNILDNPDTMRWNGGRPRIFGRTVWNPSGRR